MSAINIWSDMGDAKIIEGECIEAMRNLKSCSIDAIITDPPYGIGFMGKKWDCSVPATEWAEECLRVLKPGGHIVAFASTRTYHRLAVNLEDAGFQIRDMLTWIYYSGFPKSLNISKQIDKEAGQEREVVGWDQSKWRDVNNLKGETLGKGFNYFDTKCTITKPATKDALRFEGYGTGLKPAQEPACLARKPIEKGLSIAQNVLKWGTGAINIDGCRFSYGDRCWVGPSDDLETLEKRSGKMQNQQTESKIYLGGAKVGDSVRKYKESGRWPANLYQCAKASRSEREQGLSHLNPITGGEAVNRKEGSKGINNPRAGAGRTASLVSNFHPTVKPLKLFRWLCRLLGGEKKNVILDPFAGSGTTLAAAILEGYNVIGMEREPSYLPIIKGRVDWSIQQYKRENAQLSLFEGIQ